MKTTIACALMVLMFSPAGATAQKVTGVVLDSMTDAPVRGANVMIYDGRKVLADLKTDSTGRFDIPVRPLGTYVMQVTALGYDAYTLRLRAEMPPFAVRLLPAPVSVEGVVAQAEPRDPYLDLTGFYKRKRSEVGSFITPEQIEKRKPNRVTDLFVALPHVRLIPRGAAYEVTFRRFSSARGGCLPMIYLDGMRVGRGNIDSYPAIDLSGVEVYSSAARVPAQYGGPDAACGVILLWTRSAR